jgi:hypothetical protein
MKYIYDYAVEMTSSDMHTNFHHYFIRHFAKYNQNDQVKESEMGKTYSTNRGKGNVCTIFVVKPERKRPLGRPRLRWVNDNKMIQRDRIGWYVLY